MAKTSFFKDILNGIKSNGETKNPAIGPSAKSFIPTTQTTLRNEPWKGFTDRMLEFLCNNPIATNKQANWIDLYNEWLLMSCYEWNPVVNAVINIKADAWSNMKFEIRDLKTDDIIPIREYTADNSKLQKLLAQPSPLASSFEWLKQYKVNYGVFGNSYVYATIPVGKENTFSYKDISTLKNIPATNIKEKITGKWLETTTKEEIIEFYEFINLNGDKRPLNTNQVWQTNTSNIRLDENFTRGVSKLVALQAPISNIAGAYETRNVMIYNRGALGFLSSEKVADGTGSIALDKTEIAQVQRSMDDYGTLQGQYKHIVSPLPMKYVRMAMSIADLKVFEEVESNAIAVANSFGVPELLVKYYVKGATFDNIRASERKLYDSTIIPESKDFMIGINNFFKTIDQGIEILATFDHVAALQTNQLEEARTNSLNARTKLEAFRTGGISYDEYRESLNLQPDPDPKIGKLRVWGLTPEQLAAIGVFNVNATNTIEDGNEED